MAAKNTSGFRFRPDPLALLEEYVRRVASDGGIISRDLVRDCSPPSLRESFCSGTVLPSFETTRAHVDELQTLKGLQRGLNHFKSSLDALIESRYREILPAARHHGLASLPKEILLAILKQLFDLQEDNSPEYPFCVARAFIRDLSLVCRQFRECVLAFPEVWACLDLNRCGSELFDMFLRRSRNQPLQIRFWYTPEALERFCAAVAFSDRWEYLYADLEMIRELDKVPSLSLPGIKRFVVSGWTRGRGDVPWTTPGWSFPNAESATVGDDIPNSLSFRYESLKSLTYETSTSQQLGAPEFNEHFLARLITFLHPADSLRELHLKLHFDSYDPDVQDFDLQDLLPELELPTVEVFSISNRMSLLTPGYAINEAAVPAEPIQIDDYFTHVMRMIRLPNLKDLRVALTYRGIGFTPYTWLQNSRASKSVTSLTFEVRQADKPVDGEKRSLDIAAILAYFPDLRSLSVDCGDMVVGASERSCYGNGQPKLESLQIRELGEGGERICHALRSLAKKGVPLKKVDISSPYGFDVGGLEEVLPGMTIHTRF